MTPAARLSIVIPVRNEHENIGRCLAGLWEVTRDVPHEILIAYDSENDTTLPAIQRAAPKSNDIRLVRNDLGPSPSFAIRAGLMAATGDAVVVTMADLSDPPEALLRIAARIRRGADVVSGSRYMRGGKQIGGPWLKTLLSRTAGLTLCWLAGMGTHDATTSFRGFSRRFLDQVALESDTGFTFGLEATVKAHRRGLVVSEVPVVWSDRTAGVSNFRVGRWLGAYLRWYLLGMGEPLLVWSVWLMLMARAVSRSETALIARAIATVASFLLILLVRRARGRMTVADALIPAAGLLLLR